MTEKSNLIIIKAEDLNPGDIFESPLGLLYTVISVTIDPALPWNRQVVIGTINSHRKLHFPLSQPLRKVTP